MPWAMFRRLVSALVVAGVLCAPATAASGQDPDTPDVPAGIGVKLLEGPADSVDDPRAHTYIVDHLDPGTTISRKIGFSNGDAQPAHLLFYAAAADIEGGSFEVGDGRAANELTSWMTFSPTEATVAPGQTVPITVTITVPDGATRGEHYAAALGELPPSSSSAGVASASRVGIRLYLSVGPGGVPATTFTIDEMTASRDTEGRPVVAANVQNTGGRALDLGGELELTDGPSSLSAGPFPVDGTTTLAPGEEGTVSVILDDDLPDGPWDAHLSLTSGRTTEEATARITFPPAAGTSAPPTPASPTREAGFPLAAVVGGLLAVVLLGITILVMRRRRPRPGPEAGSPAHPPEPARF